ncbi:MAG TPA: hypothetical protein P5539_10765 [Mesotoga sp.]|nr:hypothetical protein [Mesotoga sp.]
MNTNGLEFAIPFLANEDLIRDTLEKSLRECAHGKAIIVIGLADGDGNVSANSTPAFVIKLSEDRVRLHLIVKYRDAGYVVKSKPQIDSPANDQKVSDLVAKLFAKLRGVPFLDVQTQHLKMKLSKDGEEIYTFKALSVIPLLLDTEFTTLCPKCANPFPGDFIEAFGECTYCHFHKEDKAA